MILIGLLARCSSDSADPCSSANGRTVTIHHSAVVAVEPVEATCAICGDTTTVPADEDPADTLCAICADDEANS